MATVYKGQIFKGFIALIPGVKEPIRWRYKGMWPALRTKYQRELDACNTPDEQEVTILAMMSKIIVEWNLKYPTDHPDKDKKGQPVPIDADVIKADVMVHVRNRIMAISTWQAFSDPDPLDTTAEQARSVEAKASGKTAAEMFDEEDDATTKNSAEQQGSG